MSVTTVLPAPAAAVDATAEPLIVLATVQPSRGILGRIAAVLSAHPVAELSYRAAAEGPATVEVGVPAGHAARVRAKLLRMVDVLDAETLPRS